MTAAEVHQLYRKLPPCLVYVAGVQCTLKAGHAGSHCTEIHCASNQVSGVELESSQRLVAPPVTPIAAGQEQPEAKTAPGPAQSATLQASLVSPRSNRAEHLPGIFRQAAESQDGGGPGLQVRVQALETSLHTVVDVVAGLAARMLHVELELGELHPDMALASERSRSANTGLSVLAKRVQALEQAPGAPSQAEELGAQVTKLQLVLSTLIVRLKKHAVLADILRDLKLE